MEKVTLTNMCMIRRGEEVVVQERTDPNWPGVALPGGHVEEGESLTDAVVREVQEETGLLISCPRLCGVKDWYDGNRRYLVLLYTADRFTGELRSSDEGRVWWEKLDNLKNLNLVSDLDDMLRVFLEEDLSEFFYRIEGEDWIPELK